MRQQESGLVKIWAATFIPSEWIVSSRETEQTVEFRGDDREFIPHAVTTGRCRVEQEAVVDFTRRTLTQYADTGTSVERITRRDGTEDIRTGKASTDGILCTDPTWHDDCVEFEMHASASNPLVPHPSPVDYHLALSVGRDAVEYLPTSGTPVLPDAPNTVSCMFSTTEPVVIYLQLRIFEVTGLY